MGREFDFFQGVRYFASIPSGLKPREEATLSVHHSDDLDGINRAVIGVGPYLTENHTSGAAGQRFALDRRIIL